MNRCMYNKIFPTVLHYRVCFWGVMLMSNVNVNVDVAPGFARTSDVKKTDVPPPNSLIFILIFPIYSIIGIEFHFILEDSHMLIIRRRCNIMSLRVLFRRNRLPILLL